MRKAAKACETLDLVLSVIIYLVEDKNCMAVYCRRKVDDEFDGIGVGLFLLLFWCFFFSSILCCRTSPCNYGRHRNTWAKFQGVAGHWMQLSCSSSHKPLSVCGTNQRTLSIILSGWFHSLCWGGWDLDCTERCGITNSGFLVHKNPCGQYNTPKASNVYPVVSRGELRGFAKGKLHFHILDICFQNVKLWLSISFIFRACSRVFFFPTDIIFYAEKVLLDFFILKCILPK